MPARKIAVAQIDITIADRERNCVRMFEVLTQTTAQGALITVFPEAALAGYCYDSIEQARAHAETIPGPSTERFTKFCRNFETHVIYGLIEVDGDKTYNACVLIGPGGVIGSYRKVHLPFLGMDRFMTPGDRPFAVHDAGGVRVGMHICYDGGFPEPARVMSLLGADLLVLPTNWPPGSECMAGSAVNTRAMENNVYFAACNRIGEERGFRFIGQSKICDPRGRVLAEAAHDREEILYADIDVDFARQKKIVRVPKLHEIDRVNDRRPEFYSVITEPRKS